MGCFWCSGIECTGTCDRARVHERAITAAREEGRAAGYAEAIEKAAKVCEVYVRNWSDARSPPGKAHRMMAEWIRDAIRALAPADKEPK